MQNRSLSAQRLEYATFNSVKAALAAKKI